VNAQAKGPLTERAYRRARARSLAGAGAHGIDAALEKYRVEAIIAPTGGPAWSIDLVNGDHFAGGDASTLPAVAGYPHITVPAGFVHGLPIGLSFFGAAGNEAALIRLASGFEKIAAARRPPALPPVRRP
jgi:amidase